MVSRHLRKTRLQSTLITFKITKSTSFFSVSHTKIHQIKINHIWTQISHYGTPYEAHLKNQRVAFVKQLKNAVKLQTFVFQKSQKLLTENLHQRPPIHNLPYGVLWKPIDQCFFCCHGWTGFAKHHMEGLSQHNSSLIGRKNPGKFENDCISRNGDRIKITQPNLMILVSFSSAEDALSNDVKIYYTFSSQGTENPPFGFFGGTSGIFPFHRC